MPESIVIEDPVDYAEHVRKADQAADTAAVAAVHSVLGGLMLDNASHAQIPADFKRIDIPGPAERLIYRAISELIDEGGVADVITVADRLESFGRLEFCGGLLYLNALASSVTSAANVGFYASIVQKNAGARRAEAMREDAAELLRRGGDLEEVRAKLVEIGKNGPTPAARYPLLSASDLHDLPRLAWRIHSVLPETGVAGVFGPSGSAKSFLVLDMLAAIADGRPWFGHRGKCGRSLYVVLEGEAGCRLRVEAWERDQEQAFPEGVMFLFRPFDITSRDDVLALAAAIDAAGGVDVVAIDTLNRAAPTADENSSQDMGRILDGVKALQAMMGGLVLLVHHTGKDSSKGMRGHSSLFAALDTAIEVSRTDDRREWKVAKSKDGEDGEVHPFRLARVDLGTDADGEPITSCTVKPEGGSSGYVDAVAAAAYERRAEEVCVAGFRTLQGMGITGTDGKTSPDFLPRHIVSKGLAAGYTAQDLEQAMNRLMGVGRFVRGPVGQYANRTPKLGLILKSEG